MRLRTCIKFLIFSITCLLCSSFSSDANAINFTMELAPTGVEYTNPDVQCLYGANVSWFNSTGTDTKWICNNPPSNWNGDINSVRTVNTYHVEEGNYYQIMLQLRNNNRDATIPNPIFWNFYNDENFTQVGLETYYDDTRQSYQYCQYTYESSGTNGFYKVNSTACYETDLTYNSLVIFTVRANSTGDYKFRIGNDTAVLVRANYTGLGSAGGYSTAFNFGMKKITEFTSSGTAQMIERDEQDRQDLENQVSETSSDASSSQSDAQSTGTTLLGAFSGFISALTSATPSTCVMDMDLGNLDMGNVDFCELDPPNGFSAIGSILLILFCVPLSIATARKIISLFRSFQ